MKIIFSCDIDWANEKVIEDTIDLFENHQIKCTLFVTHKSKSIDLCNRNLFEIGIHPNFNENIVNGVGLPAHENVKNLTRLYPESIGVRSHSITSSGPLLEIFKKSGLKYESNQFVPYSKSIEPYKCWNDMTIIPYNFEDDVHYTFEKSFDISLIKEFNSAKYLIMDFHPIHIYLNSESKETYIKAREYLKSEELDTFKNNNNFGTRDLLIRTFKEIKKNGLTTYHLKDLIL